jgi:hypothetical protein
MVKAWHNRASMETSMEFRREIGGLPSTAEVRAFVFRPFVNLRIQLRAANGTGKLTAHKVVQAANAEEADRYFKDFDLLPQTQGSTLILSEERRSDSLPQAQIDIDVPVEQNVAATLVGEAVDFRSEVSLESISAKCEAGSIVLHGGTVRSSIVLQAGDAALLGLRGPGHHFVELEAGDAKIELSGQVDLSWRIEADLGDIRDRRSGELRESPYFGQVGAGSGHLVCTLSVGDVEIT